MTGHLERPSQDTLETRKADNRRWTWRRRATPHGAVRSLHGAERALLLAAHQAAVAAKRASIAAAFASLLSAAEQRIIGHVQGRIASVDPALSLADRIAQIARLQAEQEAALVRLRLDIAAERRNALRTGITALSTAYRRARIALASRQQTERTALRRLRPSQSMVLELASRPGWTAVRRLALRVLPRRTIAPNGPKIRG